MAYDRPFVYVDLVMPLVKCLGARPFKMSLTNCPHCAIYVGPLRDVMSLNVVRKNPPYYSAKRLSYCYLM